MAASLGAGLSTTCVIDLGARKTSVACVEEGMILPETRCVVDAGAAEVSVGKVSHRAVLDVGGDDITEALYQLLFRIEFPYKEADLNRTYDWVLYEYLKESVCVMSEVRRPVALGALRADTSGQGDVALNLYHFDVRRPGRPLLKSAVRLFDEVILAPLVLFVPRAVDIDRKQRPMPSLWPAAADTDNLLDLGGNAVVRVARPL